MTNFAEFRDTIGLFSSLKNHKNHTHKSTFTEILTHNRSLIETTKYQPELLTWEQYQLSKKIKFKTSQLKIIDQSKRKDKVSLHHRRRKPKEMKKIWESFIMR